MLTRTKEETLNTLTHLSGMLFAALTSWYMIWLGYCINWQYTLGVSIFIAGMLMMYTCSSLYHWWVKTEVKKLLRKLDHISIYVM
ncbi:MAG: hemolysin III family protein, partial [Bacteroidaceae bacterium]|nr:hemolysin III family protein [Bacteroidaceae bacterium]